MADAVAVAVAAAAGAAAAVDAEEEQEAQLIKDQTPIRLVRTVDISTRKIECGDTRHRQPLTHTSCSKHTYIILYYSLNGSLIMYITRCAALHHCILFIQTKKEKYDELRENLL